MTAPFNKPPKPSLLKEREDLCFNPPQGYNAVHFNRETGGLVLQHQQHNLQEIESELVIAKTFADQNGDLIELLPERKQPQGVKAPDARHNKKHIWEYKVLTEEAITLRTAVDRKIRETIEQKAPNLAILIDRQKYDIQEINKGFAFGIDGDEDSLIQNLSLVFKGKIQTINRRDWNNGSRFSKF